MADDTKNRLLERKARIEAQLKAIEAREHQQKRKDDTRRKIIAGALALENAELSDDFRQELFKLLNRYVKRPEDRRLFDLPERGEPGQEQDNVSPDADFGEAAKKESA